nr:zinc finger matrin-type protein 5 [Pelodiscus sinensis]|eukprot:XP_025045509.1 zinc finger matrin-type protein 5 [Pelodiscus sinensis]
MGKRYFCDYCDRSFQDNLHNRKKHLNGVQHLRAKKAWYDLFRGESGSSQAGGCGCPSPLLSPCRLSELRCCFFLSPSSPSEKTVFQYPPGWPPIQDLPPSLQAPPPGGWLVPPNLQWG